LHESDCSDRRRGSVSVPAFATALGIELRLLDLFEEIRVENGRGNLVVARCPLTEIEETAAIGAEGNVWGVEWDFFAADGTVESLGHVRYSMMRATTS
jgi:hypothetical protein